MNMNEALQKPVGIEVQFTTETAGQSKKEDFLSNNRNKSLFISKLAVILKEDGQDVILSKSDADTDIVKEAIRGTPNSFNK